MGILRERLVSRENAIATFGMIVFVIHIWSIYNLLNEVPAWLLRLSTWELVGVVSYTLVFALIESLIILCLFVLAAAILPERFYRQKFVSISVIFITLAALWVLPVHLYEDAIRSWGLPGMVGLVSLMLISFIVAYVLVFRSSKFEESILSIAQRVTVLAVLYLLVDLAAFMILVSRNVTG